MAIALPVCESGVTDQACVWMTAGVLAYKLCDRDFDCEHCPLDAALRGDPWCAVALGGVHQDRAPAVVTFPEDRVFSRGHTWLRPLDRSRSLCRFGVDGFAASLIGPVLCVRRSRPLDLLRAGDSLCTLGLEEGDLALSTPVAAGVRAWNQALAERPQAVTDAPYGAGWVAELALDSPSALDHLFRSEEARREARLDARRFCRAAAMELLSVAGGVDALGAPGAITDLRRMLGPSRFLMLARDFIH